MQYTYGESKLGPTAEREIATEKISLTIRLVQRAEYGPDLIKIKSLSGLGPFSPAQSVLMKLNLLKM